MLGQFFGSIGGAIGSVFGGGILSTIGRFAGKYLGNYLERENRNPTEYWNIKNLKDSFHISKAKYGDVIPLIFGTVKVNGRIIWASQIKENNITNSEKRYFNDSNQLRSVHNTIQYEYYISLAISICEGTISEIGRIWANENLIDISKYKFRLYNGSEEQIPDPLICKVLNGKAPAFRDLAYIIFEDLPLADFNDIIPNFSFEVTRKANIPARESIDSVEDLVKAMVMIPGCGEFVYDTIIQHKIVSNGEIEIAKEVINSHNFRNVANSIHSLNQLRVVCSNVEWIAPVVCWFGDSLNIAGCNILPGVEFKDPNASTSEKWKVADYTRETARLISKEFEDNPRYGGSVNDASVLRYLKELKARKYKVMFYPMFFLDIEKKPWRGHLTGNSEDIPIFFNKPNGYNNFIMHYARLVKDLVDCFIIGSELIGLTKVKDVQGNFLAVFELINLAKQVKELLGSNVLVSYAADWSEYHHTDGGWYNLDPLWASPYIDFVGIDSYFPITNTTNSDISKEEIIKGIESGEGYEYYIDADKNKQPLSKAYSWKNLQYWWENIHINPNGEETLWRPKMKNIWFTEFGFPSIDKATNQPNIFFDPLCVDGGKPINSSGDVDFSIQRKAIRTFIEYWGSKEYISQIFLWTWDVRPYPAWPHMNIWKDAHLWERGHWVNNKFGASSLSNIILEISNRCSIDLAYVDVSELDESIEGIKFDTKISAFNAINLLRISNFFDLTTSSCEQIRFIKRCFKTHHNLSSNNLIKLSDNSYLFKHEIAKDQIINGIEMYFLDHANEYKCNYSRVKTEIFSSKRMVSINLPIVMSSLEAERLSKLILLNASNESKLIKFIIPETFIEYEPTDFVTVTFCDYTYNIRITSIKVHGLKKEITGIFDNPKSYHLPRARTKEIFNYQFFMESNLLVLDIPPIFTVNNESYVTAYLQSKNKEPLYASLNGVDGCYTKISNIDEGGIIGKVSSFNNNSSCNVFVIDELSTFTIFAHELKNGICDDWNIALCGEEILHFKKCVRIEENIYTLSHFIRGSFGTEEFIKKHLVGERFVLLNVKPNLIPVSSNLENKDIYFKTNNSQKQLLNFQNKSKKLLPPFVDACSISNNSLSIKWRMRSIIPDDWISYEQQEEYEFYITLFSEATFHTFKTKNFYLEEKIDNLGLMEGFNIKIMVKTEKSKSNYVSLF